MSTDAKIGLWTVTVLTALALLSSFRDSGILDLKDQVGLLFTQVHGLRVGDPVTIGGVKSGRVVSIDFAPDEIQEAFAPITGGTMLVRALVTLDGRRKIPKESTYAIRVDLNGLRWLDITLSPIVPGVEMIGPDDNFFAEETFGQEDQLAKTVQTFQTLTVQTEELRNQLTDPEFLLQTKDTASNLRFYSREMVAASSKVPAQLDELNENLDRQEILLLQKMKEFDQKTQEVASRMIEMAPQMSETLQGWSLRIERQGDRLASTLQMASTRTEEYQKMLDEALTTVLNPDTIENMVKQTRRWGRKMEEYRYLAEDLHSLTSDPTIRADLKKAISQFRVESEKMNQKVEKLEQSLKKIPFVGPRLDDSPVEVEPE